MSSLGPFITWTTTIEHISLMRRQKLLVSRMVCSIVDFPKKQLNDAHLCLVDMTIDDLLSLTPKFWQLHNDPAVLLDGGAITLLTIQYNLCAGTIARYTGRRPELIPLVEDLLQYRKQ